MPENSSFDVMSKRVPCYYGEPPMPRKAIARRSFIGFLLILLIVAIIAKFNFSTVVVKGPSMQPTFFTGRRLLVSHAWWLVGSIHDNDIVVVTDHNPDGYIIKRVYKMAGEVVDWANVPKNYDLAKGTYTVPPHMIYLLGDNREKSEDSRFFGPVDLSRALGKVLIFR
jgi:signal peptidase I